MAASVAPTVLKSQSTEGIIIGPFKMTVADSVDGLLYMPDASGNLIVATGNVLCGVPTNRVKIGEYTSLRITGLMVVQAAGEIFAQAPLMATTGGKVTTATVGTHQVHGWIVGPASGADGDLITMLKVS